MPHHHHNHLHQEFRACVRKMYDILPITVNTIRGEASRTRQVPNIVAGNPTDDLFEETLTQADCQIQGMSIADPKPGRFTDRERLGMTSTLKRRGLECMDPKIQRTSPKSQGGKTCNWLDNTT